MQKKQVQALFNFTLNEIYKDLGNLETDNFQLNDYCKDIGIDNFVGVFALDEIPQLKNNQNCIINLDTSNEPGSHWVALFKYRNKTYFFDSFNRKILPYTRVVIDKHMKQKNRYEDCGQRCIVFLCLVQVLGLHDTLKL